MTPPARPVRFTYNTRAHAPEHDDDPEYGKLVAMDAAKLDLLRELADAYIPVRSAAEALLGRLDRGEKPYANDPFPQLVRATREQAQRRVDVLAAALAAGEELLAAEDSQYQAILAELFPTPPASARAARRTAPATS